MLKTFKIGGVHPEDNKLTRAVRTEIAELPKQAVFPLSQHIGAPAVPCVQKGDLVKVGTVIAKAGGFVSADIHSSVSGKVAKIDTVVDASGYRKPAIFIDVEGDEWEESIDRSDSIVRECSLAPQEIIDRIKNSGVVGMGGACFPTHVKMMPPKDCKLDCLIVNGVECEPFLTADHRLMLEHPDEVLIGVSIIMKALSLEKAYIGIEENKMDAVELLRGKAGDFPGVEIVPLKMKYPQGGEKQLIDAVVGRQVPAPPAIPANVGALVQNVGTVFAIYEAVQKNKPLISRVMTVTGKDVKNPGNYEVRFGTPLERLIGVAGGIPESTGKIIGGGPMMGRAMTNIDMPTHKRISGCLFLTKEESVKAEPSPCIRCAKCVNACPMGLEPYMLAKLSAVNNVEKMEELQIMDCIDCGCCVFTCPSHRPLLDYIRPGKGAVGAAIRARQAAK